MGKPRHSPYSKPCITWTHKVVGLDDTGQDSVPSATQKYELSNGGLGEKKVVFKLDCDWSHIKDKMLDAFPPLKDEGGIELLRCDGPYSKVLRVIKSKHLKGVASLKQHVGQAKIYVRPLQSSINLCQDEDIEEVSSCIDSGRAGFTSYG